MSESVPSSVTGFAHRRDRADSVASFTYFQEDEDSPEWSDDQAIIDEDVEDADVPARSGGDLEYDLELGSTSPKRRKSSGFSRTSAENPLLSRHDSAKTDTSGLGRGARSNQKIYVMTEDLTIVVAGFTTQNLGFLIYLCCCVLTLGLGYLVLRWLPRLRVRLIGSPKPLRECDWVVVEVRTLSRPRRSKPPTKFRQNQWGEFAVQSITKASYGHSASTVFGLREKKGYSLDYDEDDDPVLMNLRFLDYRYIRFCFHPLKDKFVLCSDWKDPNWTDVKSIRAGLDSDERHRREQVFGKNAIEIEEKSIPQLLVDEVNFVALANICVACLLVSGLSSFLHIPDRKFDSLVFGRLLLLCSLYLHYLSGQHNNNLDRN